MSKHGGHNKPNENPQSRNAIRRREYEKFSKAPKTPGATSSGGSSSIDPKELVEFIRNAKPFGGRHRHTSFTGQSSSIYSSGIDVPRVSAIEMTLGAQHFKASGLRILREDAVPGAGFDKDKAYAIAAALDRNTTPGHYLVPQGREQFYVQCQQTQEGRPEIIVPKVKQGTPGATFSQITGAWHLLTKDPIAIVNFNGTLPYSAAAGTIISHDPKFKPVPRPQRRDSIGSVLDLHEPGALDAWALPNAKTERVELRGLATHYIIQYSWDEFDRMGAFYGPNRGFLDLERVSADKPFSIIQAARASDFTFRTSASTDARAVNSEVYDFCRAKAQALAQSFGMPLQESIRSNL